MSVKTSTTTKYDITCDNCGKHVGEDGYILRLLRLDVKNKGAGRRGRPRKNPDLAGSEIPTELGACRKCAMASRIGFVGELVWAGNQEEPVATD